MYHDRWNDGYERGHWLPMILMMVVVVGAIVWLGIYLARRSHHTPVAAPTAPTAPLAPARPSARDILDERLARGEIDPDDYRARLDALNAATPPG